MEPSRTLALIRSAMSRGVEAIALTSGVVGSERKIVKLMVDTVGLIRREIGSDIPIGLEPYVTRKEHIDELYGGGADEIKVNLESFDERIVKTVCPEMNYDEVSAALEYSVDVFGEKGSPVSSIVSGEVVKAVKTDDGTLGGARVWVEGDDGWWYYYAHLDTVTVEKGDRVDTAEQLGTMGNTGNAATTPTHLHLEQHFGATDGAFVNPFAMISSLCTEGS